MPKRIVDEFRQKLENPATISEALDFLKDVISVNAPKFLKKEARELGLLLDDKLLRPKIPPEKQTAARLYFNYLMALTALAKSSLID